MTQATPAAPVAKPRPAPAAPQDAPTSGDVSAPLAAPAVTPEPVSPAGGERRLFTAAEYDKLCEEGFFGDEKIELIRGEIRVMAPQGPVHPTIIDIASRRLDRAYEGVGYTRVQSTYAALDSSRPEPDMMVLRGKPQDYFEHLPAETLLLVEVSYTTQRYDRGVKLGLYAEAGVAEYWVIDGKKRTLEVYRGPAREADGSWRYGSMQTLAMDQTVTPVTAPQHPILVSELMS